MTPKEKAKELYNKCEDSITGLEGHEWWDSAKQCALIAVEEMLSELYHIAYDDDDYGEWKMKYWQEVKQEIEKL
jgi:hypothetical protein